MVEGRIPETSIKTGAAESKDEESIRMARSLQNVPWCDHYERMISGMLYEIYPHELGAELMNFAAMTLSFPSWPTLVSELGRGVTAIIPFSLHQIQSPIMNRCRSCV